ncbi:MAG: putative Ig domain-containing protein [Candidatus Parcubacteria bacterium]|nr:putative Ig domain-containing protein [Candidatus Parcubacteria bacterium]
MMVKCAFLAVIFQLFLLAACNSGGGHKEGVPYVPPTVVINHAPVITSTPIATATAETAYAYDVDATDADSDTLIYSLEIGPTGLTINSASGLINWTPTLVQVGDQTVKIKVTDGKIDVFQEYTITVSLPPNHAPVITSVAITTATTETPYAYDVNATDADGDTLTYSLEIAPTGMTINSANGLINWTPILAQIGNHAVKVQVSDGTDMVFQEFTITVSLPPNHAPVITSMPITVAIAGDIYGYDLNATDADADTLTYSVEIGPTGLTINSSTGLVSWVSEVIQVGDHTVKLKVSDGKAEVFQEYTITVSLPPPNMAPDIVSEPVRTATAEKEFTYTVDADDPEGDSLTYSLITYPAGMSIDSATGKITWTPTSAQVGNHKVEVQVTDSFLTDSQKFAIRVIPTDNGIPYQCGCTITSYWWNDYQQLKAKQTVDLMKADGCAVISVLVTWYQDGINSTDIHSIASKTPSDAGLIQIIDYIHSLGLKVALKPHVDVWSGAWRGEITFTLEADYLAWFASYTAFINYYLDLAEAHGVEFLFLGTEFKKLEFRASDWRSQIANARTRYSGQLSYAANWDSYSAITWWDDLDFISVDAYFPLTSSYSPTLLELIAAWTIWKNIGYQSLDGTNITPSWRNTSVIDLQEQADCYQAAMTVVFNEPWFKGMYGWMWYWDPAQDVNKFDVWNKPAELIMRDWYAGY